MKEKNALYLQQTSLTALTLTIMAMNVGKPAADITLTIIITLAGLQVALTAFLVYKGFAGKKVELMEVLLGILNILLNTYIIMVYAGLIPMVPVK